MKKLIQLCFVLLAFLLFSKRAEAATCTAYSLQGIPNPVPVQVQWTFAFTNLYDWYSAPVGSVVIRGQRPSLSTSDMHVDCSGPTTLGTVNLIGAQASMPMINGGVYPTNVPGVGYRLSGLVYPYTFDPSQTNDVFQGVTLEFVKTGPVTGGTISKGMFAIERVDGLNPTTLAQYYLMDDIIISPPTCTVNPGSKNVPVTLPGVNISVFSGVGVVAERIPFKLSINCPISKAVSVKLDYNGNNTNIPGVLSNTGTAAGVGVQLLDQNQSPVPFGTVVPKGSYQGAVDIPFFAQYYQLDNGVSAGTVSSSATFTFSYQ
jgi:type 1 fimbria pilin